MPVDDRTRTDDRPLGLRYWMERVLEEIDRASQDFAPDPVHDLRVTLRRCRSLSQGFMAVDPDKAWKAMQKEDQRLFRRLGKLRDVQVSKDAVLRLGGPEDPVSVAMLSHLDQREQELKLAALKALEDFDQDKWRRRITRLHTRTRHLPPGDPAFQLIALQAWTEAQGLHRQATRNRSAVAYHRLRIAIKRFRYVVENFLPRRHAEWGEDLKQIQDCLGEAQDFRVLWGKLLRLGAFPDPASRDRWRALIVDEQAKRRELYRAKTVGSNSLWPVWQQGLPPLERLRPLSLAMMEKWAYFHGIDVARARGVRRLALRLFDGLRRARQMAGNDGAEQRAVLHLAATLHEPGREKPRKSDRTSPMRLLRGLPSSPGLPPEMVQRSAFVVHCSRGKFWDFEGGGLVALPEEQRQPVMKLAGILRLARVLARGGELTVESVRFDPAGDVIVIRVRGYSEFGPLAEKVARARCHLEYACQRPIIVRGAREDRSAGEGNGEPA
jgi:CHAD domain-containing protein